MKGLPRKRGLQLWAGLCMALACLEWPIVYCLWHLMPPVLQPYPSLDLVLRQTDVFADLRLPAVGLIYLLLWPCLYALLGPAISRRSAGVVWTASSLLILAVLLHVVIHYTQPYLLVLTDGLGLSATELHGAPRYLSLFQPPPARFLELPLVVGLATSYVLVRNRNSREQSGEQDEDQI